MSYAVGFGMILSSMWLAWAYTRSNLVGLLAGFLTICFAYGERDE